MCLRPLGHSSADPYIRQGQPRQALSHSFMQSVAQRSLLSLSPWDAPRAGWLRPCRNGRSQALQIATADPLDPGRHIPKGDAFARRVSLAMPMRAFGKQFLRVGRSGGYLLGRLTLQLSRTVRYSGKTGSGYRRELQGGPLAVAPRARANAAHNPELRSRSATRSCGVSGCGVTPPMH